MARASAGDTRRRRRRRSAEVLPRADGRGGAGRRGRHAGRGVAPGHVRPRRNGARARRVRKRLRVAGELPGLERARDRAPDRARAAPRRRVQPARARRAGARARGPRRPRPGRARARPSDAARHTSSCTSGSARRRRSARSPTRSASTPPTSRARSARTTARASASACAGSGSNGPPRVSSARTRRSRDWPSRRGSSTRATSRAPSRAGSGSRPRATAPRTAERAERGYAPRVKQLWAPWRLEYVAAADEQEGCVFCLADAGDDEERLVVHRGERALVLLNKFPYASGHLMVAPRRHVGVFGELDDERGARAAPAWRRRAWPRSTRRSHRRATTRAGTSAGSRAPGSSTTSTCTSSRAGPATRTSCPCSRTSRCSPSTCRDAAQARGRLAGLAVVPESVFRPMARYRTRCMGLAVCRDGTTVRRELQGVPKDPATSPRAGAKRSTLSLPGLPDSRKPARKTSGCTRPVRTPANPRHACPARFPARDEGRQLGHIARSVTPRAAGVFLVLAAFAAVLASQTAFASGGPTIPSRHTGGYVPARGAQVESGRQQQPDVPRRARSCARTRRTRSTGSPPATRSARTTRR